MRIKVFRDYKNHHTDGELFIDDSALKFCCVLEDIGRPPGIKIAGETCVPEGMYKVAITRSGRWKKDMLLLYNNDNMCCERGGVEFSGIRPHGGNDVSDTHGCPLLGFETNHEGRIWNRASDDLFGLVKAALARGEQVTWEIVS